MNLQYQIGNLYDNGDTGDRSYKCYSTDKFKYSVMNFRFE